MPFRGIVTKTLLESNCGKLFLTMGKFPFEYWLSARLKLEIVVLKFLLLQCYVRSKENMPTTMLKPRLFDSRTGRGLSCPRSEHFYPKFKVLNSQRYSLEYKIYT